MATIEELQMRYRAALKVPPVVWRNIATLDKLKQKLLIILKSRKLVDSQTFKQFKFSVTGLASCHKHWKHWATCLI